MKDCYQTCKLIEQRKQTFLQEAQANRLSHPEKPYRPTPGIVGSILLRAGDVLVAAGEALKTRHTPQPYTHMNLEVK